MALGKTLKMGRHNAEDGVSKRRAAEIVALLSEDDAKALRELEYARRIVLSLMDPDQSAPENGSVTPLRPAVPQSQ